MGGFVLASWVFNRMVDPSGIAVMSVGAPGVSSFVPHPLNTAGARFAYIYIPSQTAVIQQLHVWVHLNAGTVTRSQVRCRIHNANAALNAPGTAIGAEVPLDGAGNLPSSGGFEYFNFSAQNITLNRGVPYWFVIRNANGSPASNNFRLYYGDMRDPACAAFMSSSVNTAVRSTFWFDWRGCIGARFVYNSGDEGVPLSPVPQYSLSSHGPSKYVGLRISVPGGSVPFNLAGVTFPVQWYTDAIAQVIYRVFDASGNVLAHKAVRGLQRCGVMFDRPVLLLPGNTYYIAVARSLPSSQDIVHLDCFLSYGYPSLVWDARPAQSTDGGSTWSTLPNLYINGWSLLFHHYESVATHYLPVGYAHFT